MSVVSSLYNFIYYLRVKRYIKLSLEAVWREKRTLYTASKLSLIFRCKDD